ncbi:MAG: DUF192 domain-containing protein [Planctomycetota bacterium]|nr:MAG: DUF192 domain-containing protein [Planctomycetota bacterium]
MKSVAAWAAAIGVFCVCACSPTTQRDSQPGGSTLSGVWEPEGPTQEVRLPDGSVIEAELRLTPEEQATGMMFRPQLPPDKGMLFLFSTMEPRAFWMYQTNAPLDIIWMDDNKRIVEISENTPPCPSRDARECPTYGGTAHSVYVLEAAAGFVARHNLKIGDQLEF